jgi:hypothetical protein
VEAENRIGVLAEWLKQTFATDVEAAQHDDPMTDEDWRALAEAALREIDDD